MLGLESEELVLGIQYRQLYSYDGTFEVGPNST